MLRGEPNVVQVVPLTRTIRFSGADMSIEPEGQNHLRAPSAAQCRHVRSISVTRLSATRGTVGSTLAAEIREVLGPLIDL